MASAQRLLAEGWRVQGLSRRAAGIDHPRFHWTELQPQDGQAMWQVHVAAASHLVNTLHARLHPGARIVMIGSRTMQGVVKRPARGL